jgi:RNA polymerase sigma-70 factor, ECF subfamily
MSISLPSTPKRRLWWLERISFFLATLRQSSDGITQSEDDDIALQAFYEIFARYQKPIADFLYRMTHDYDWAADLTQDTFLKAYSHRADLPAIANVRAWLYRIASNTANNALRHKRRFIWVPLADLTPADSNEPSNAVIVAASGDIATSVVERDALMRALDTLTPTARGVLLLRATAGFDTSEIATMMSLTEANVRKILYRSKEKLRQILTQSSNGAGEEIL